MHFLPEVIFLHTFSAPLQKYIIYLENRDIFYFLYSQKFLLEFSYVNLLQL